MTGTDLRAGNLEPAHVDPFRASPPHSFDAGHIRVRHRAGGAPSGGTLVVRTRHFSVYRNGGRLHVFHGLRPCQVSNDLASLLIDELFAPGWLHGRETFEAILTGLVRSTVGDPLEAWLTFYRNTLDALRRALTPTPEREACSSTVAGIAPVYGEVLRLASPRSVLDLGSCFGFLPLLLAETGVAVTATDISPSTMNLLAAVAEASQRRVATVACDAARVPLADDAAETVTVVHLLEHLEPAHGLAVVREALRLASRRVIVAVPMEAEPTAAFGHVRTFDLAGLGELGAAAGTRCAVWEYHGGWLLLDAS